MKHDDERRASSTVQEARKDEYLADPVGLVTKYVGLLSRDSVRAERLKKYESELRKLNAELRQYRAEVTRRRSETARLETELADVRHVLYELRRSWRIRVGRVLTDPIRISIRILGATLTKIRTVYREILRRINAVRHGEQRSKDNALTTDVIQVAPTRADLIRGDSEGPRDKYAVLKRSVAYDPTPTNVLALLQYCYFTEGKIEEPIQLIEKYGYLLEKTGSKASHLIGMVQGLGRLREKVLVLPPRQSNAGYVAEPGRVMYCAHSTVGYNSNGYSTRTAGLCGGLADNDVDTVVVARPGYPWDVKTDRGAPSQRRMEESVEGVPHIYTPGLSWSTEPLDYYLQQATDVYVREAIKHRVTVIHAASNHVTAYPALIAARRLGLPFIYEVRGLWEITEASWKAGWDTSERYQLAVELEKVVANNADGILAITQQVANVLIERGAEPNIINILPNAVDSDEFSPLGAHVATRAKLGIPEDALVVGYAGSLVSYEGLDTLVDAASLVLRRRNDIRFVIVGDGAGLEGLKDRAKELQIADEVIFTGRIRPHEVPHYISIFDIMPCPRHSSAVTELVPPLKPLEAMASGKAVVLSDVAPLKDIAGEHAERAIVCEASSVDDLARAILTLAEDQQLRIDLGRRARQWIVGERTWKTVSLKAKADYQQHESVRRAPGGLSQSLRDLTIGLIADEFTTEGLRSEVHLIEINPERWQEQLANNRIDALIVESAWEGVDKSWHRKVGYYDDEAFSTLKALTGYCHGSGIPTIFWNKEDPVHFNRFRKTSMHFEHVFTTDADSMPSYLRSAGVSQRTVSSLPFYAQPRLHNPLPGDRGFANSAAYAGSYYGDRYKDRSAQLRTLLSAASPTGLTIYDRQHLNPESPYKFPAELGRYVAGGLTYPQMIEAYKAHPVHINVNSVENSPTMFSRRVVEAAACGAAVVSGPGMGVADVFDGRIPIVASHKDAELLINRWMTHEDARKRDAWLGMRTVFRAHTAAHRLAYMLRTVGLQVNAPSLPAYAVVVKDLTESVVQELNQQSVRPHSVLYFGEVTADSLHGLHTFPFSPERLKSLKEAGVQWAGGLSDVSIDRVYFEDMLTSTLYGSWEAVAVNDVGLHQADHGLATETGLAATGAGLILVENLDANADSLEAALGGVEQKTLRGLQLCQAGVPPVQTSSGEAPPPRLDANRRKKIVVAGHDLKFATKIIEEFSVQGHEVVIDQWSNHTQHDEEYSLTCLRDADVIFCEWALGNAVWYSNNKQQHQRMIVRFHLQELFTPHPTKLRMEAVDKFIFVGAHLRDMAVRDFGLDARRCLVIPNYIDDDLLNRPKNADARFNLGLVGIVPRRKRLDQALDVLVALRATDDRYRLFIKGKTPADYPWMADRSEEMAFYDSQYQRIETDPMLAGAVHFDGYSDDMSSWYQKIGVVLSVSDFESFHLTLPDGASSGALPAALGWAGADRIYPQSWISPDVSTLIEYILTTCRDKPRWEEHTEAAKSFALSAFSKSKVIAELTAVIAG